MSLSMVVDFVLDRSVDYFAFAEIVKIRLVTIRRIECLVFLPLVSFPVQTAPDFGICQTGPALSVLRLLDSYPVDLLVMESEVVALVGPLARFVRQIDCHCPGIDSVKIGSALLAFVASAYPDIVVDFAVLSLAGMEADSPLPGLEKIGPLIVGFVRRMAVLDRHIVLSPDTVAYFDHLFDFVPAAGAIVDPRVTYSPVVVVNRDQKTGRRRPSKIRENFARENQKFPTHSPDLCPFFRQGKTQGEQIQ